MREVPESVSEKRIQIRPHLGHLPGGGSSSAPAAIANISSSISFLSDLIASRRSSSLIWGNDSLANAVTLSSMP